MNVRLEEQLQFPLDVQYEKDWMIYSGPQNIYIYTFAKYQNARNHYITWQDIKVKHTKWLKAQFKIKQYS